MQCTGNINKVIISYKNKFIKLTCVNRYYETIVTIKYKNELCHS